MDYEIVDYQNKYLKYKKKYLDLTNVNKNDIMTQINKFAYLDYTTRYVMLGGNINDLHDLQGGDLSSLLHSAHNALNSAASVIYHAPGTVFDAASDASHKLYNSVNSATNKLKENAQYTIDTIELYSKNTSAALDAITLERFTNFNIRAVLMLLRALASLNPAELSKKFNSWLEANSDNCFSKSLQNTIIYANTIDLKKGTANLYNNAGKAASATAEALMANATKTATALKTALPAAKAAIIATGKAADKAIREAPHKLYVSTTKTAQEIAAFAIAVSKLTKKDMSDLMTTGLEILWCYLSVAATAINPFPNHMACLKGIWDIMTKNILRLYNATLDTVAAVGTTVGTAVGAIPLREKLLICNVSPNITDLTGLSDEYIKIDKDLHTLYNCLKLLIDDLNKIDFGLSLTSAALIVIPGAQPGAAISGVILLITNTIKKLVSNLYLVVEAAYLCGISTNDDFESSKKKLKDVMARNPISMLKIIDIEGGIIPILEASVLLKQQMQKNFPEFMTSEYEKMKVKLTTTIINHDPNDDPDNEKCYFFYKGFDHKKHEKECTEQEKAKALALAIEREKSESDELAKLKDKVAALPK
jgi:hypothetical protein